MSFIWVARISTKRVTFWFFKNDIFLFEIFVKLGFLRRTRLWIIVLCLQSLYESYSIWWLSFKFRNQHLMFWSNMMLSNKFYFLLISLYLWNSLQLQLKIVNFSFQSFSLQLLSVLFVIVFDRLNKLSFSFVIINLWKSIFSFIYMKNECFSIVFSSKPISKSSQLHFDFVFLHSSSSSIMSTVLWANIFGLK